MLKRDSPKLLRDTPKLQLRTRVLTRLLLNCIAASRSKSGKFLQVYNRTYHLLIDTLDLGRMVDNQATYYTWGIYIPDDLTVNMAIRPYSDRRIDRRTDRVSDGEMGD